MEGRSILPSAPTPPHRPPHQANIRGPRSASPTPTPLSQFFFCWGARSTSPHTTSHPIPNSFLLGATVGVSPRHTSPTQQTHNSFDYTWSTRKASLCMGCDCVCFVCLSVGYNSCFFFSCGWRASELSRPWAARPNAKKTQSRRTLRTPKTSSVEGSQICSASKITITPATTVVAHTRAATPSRRSGWGSNQIDVFGIVGFA